MDKVLIVDTDLDILNKAEEGFKELHHFDLLTAASVQSAIAILQKERISVLATDIRLAEHNGIELLAYMTRKFPSIPCIALLEKDDPKPWFPERDGHVGVLHYVRKHPFSFGDLATAIFVGLNLRDEGLTRKGLVLRHFLPLPVLLQKTCRLEFRYNAEKTGTLYFNRGELLDAHIDGTSGAPALKEMAGWQGIQMTVSELPADRKQKRITGDMMAIVKATWKNAPGRTTPQQEPRRTEQITRSAAAAAPDMSRQSVKPAGPDPKKTPNPNRLEIAVNRHSGILRTIKGYKGMAVINTDGKVLAADLPEGAIEFTAISEAISRMHADCSKHLNQKGMGPCNGLTLHTPQGLLSMRSTDVYAGGNFRFIAALSEEGNGHFLQVQLKTIIPKIMAELSNTGSTAPGKPE